MKRLAVVGDFEIYTDSRSASGDAFYVTMGRHFADPKIRKELGEAMSDGGVFRGVGDPTYRERRSRECRNVTSGSSCDCHQG